ncbi:MAG: type II secretion system major pseudopilin GspG [Gammaproteobacteria bacterium]|nr:type II secretion system major pseudopilin GspG [Gammaproteobacteria bacterium]
MQIPPTSPAPAPARSIPAGQRGFTLIEIMVVVIIIGLLAAVVVPQFFGHVDDARIAKAKQDIQAIETALTMFKLDNFRYPSSEQGLKALVEKPGDESIRNWRPGGYLKRVTRDPWGNDYQYANPGTHGGDFDLYSMGADGKPGGDDVNADIGNWNLGQ